MALHYLVIEREDENQTLEAVQLLPQHVQRQIALFDIPASELAGILNSAKGYEKVAPFIPQENQENLQRWSKDIKEALENPNNFVITYDDDVHYINVGGCINTSVEINGECTMHIVAGDEGYTFDIYSTKELQAEQDDIADPVASTYVYYSELNGEED